ncbi:MAG: 3-methyladenine DNA glycosylase, partial [Bradyrhizobiaceae bacterium]
VASMQLRRGLQDERLLCSGPGRLCAALGITGTHDGAPLDCPPFELLARSSVPEMVVGVRIGITKGVELPWRFGLKGSRYFSKPFAKM